MRWKPFEINGKIYDLTHLHPKTLVFKQEAKDDKPERTYQIMVIYGLHCFSRKIGDTDTDERYFYSDDREKRVFDIDRYAMSEALPAIIDALNQKKCFHTGHGNFFIVELINNDGNNAEYEVYFKVSKSSKKDTLNLFIESAYVRDRAHSNRARKKPIRFNVILYNVFEGKPIKAPP